MERLMGTCVDITAETLASSRDPRGEIGAFFTHKSTPIGVRWVSRYRIGIDTISIDGVGFTKMDKARLKLRSMFRMKVPHE